MRAPLERAFTLSIGDRPIVSFVARNQIEARELAREARFRDDLALCQSHGQPVWNGEAKLSVRPSTPEETAVLLEATNVIREDDGIVLAFPVELDSATP